MPIIGIDIGNDSCHLAAYRNKTIEILMNESNSSSTPFYIAFKERDRSFGSPAQTSLTAYIKSTFGHFKRFIGVKFDDPVAIKERSLVPFPIYKLENGNIGVKVKYDGSPKTFSITELVAMFLIKLKDIARLRLGSSDFDCVLSVPSYFTNDARLAMLDAAAIAKLNVCRLINETTAVALLYRSMHLESFEKNFDQHFIIVIDMGYSSLQASAFCIDNTDVKVQANKTCLDCGGRDFDIVIASYFAQKFKKEQDVDVLKDAVSTILFFQECEKFKKQISANTTSAMPFNFDVYRNKEQISLSSKMDGKLLKELCRDLLLKVDDTLRRLLAASRFKTKHITSIELVGGSTRMPFIKAIAADVFCKTPSTSLSTDEAVVKGSTYQCIMVARNQIKIATRDVQLYPIRSINFIKEGNQLRDEVVVPIGAQLPYKKDINVRTDSNVHFHYATEYESPAVNNLIGIGTIPTSYYHYNHSFNLRVVINENGILQCGPSRGNEDVRVPFKDSALSKYSLGQGKVVQEALIKRDDKEELRLETKNQLETYIYRCEAKLKAGEWKDSIDDDGRKIISVKVEETLKWVEGEGKLSSAEIFAAKKKKIEDVIEKKQQELIERLKAIEMREKFWNCIIANGKLLADGEWKDSISEEGQRQIFCELKEWNRWIKNEGQKSSSDEIEQNMLTIKNMIQEKQHEHSEREKAIEMRNQFGNYIRTTTDLVEANEYQVGEEAQGKILKELLDGAHWINKDETNYSFEEIRQKHLAIEFSIEKLITEDAMNDFMKYYTFCSAQYQKGAFVGLDKSLQVKHFRNMMVGISQWIQTNNISATRSEIKKVHEDLYKAVQEIDPNINIKFHGPIESIQL